MDRRNKYFGGISWIVKSAKRHSAEELTTDVMRNWNYER